ncbi:glycosyltransferase family 4 protein [uncultured Eudoraea sp.]|uniref:glycosyltransferase family 4 protein n=1 Tax=uncultured Eudoraea sp. TaxID=1035614 RepID=UPI002625A3D9|nr:glycosyltransferase family 4 protein [uncultured Eudoraea sp.]
MHKVLIISYYWPPAGGPGVQRWLKFVKYLPEFDIHPVIYIPENPKYPITDSSLTKEIPENVTIYTSKIFEPYLYAGFLSKKKTKQISSGVISDDNASLLENFLLWIRGNVFIPDARKYWVRPSVRFLTGIIKKEEIDTIITTGPPHSLHLIGLELKKNLDVKWLADFRDPWTSIGYHSKLRLTKASERKHRLLEKEVANGCDKLLVTSNTTKVEFESITTNPVYVITNGYDIPESELPFSALDKKFTLSHIGSLLTGRNPENLWKVLSEIIGENETFRNVFQLNLIGVVGQDVLNSINDNGLKNYTRIKEYVTHEEAVNYQRSSQLLLLVEIDAANTRGIIPGKLFEYLAAKRPILAIGPEHWDGGEIVKRTNSGVVCNYNSLVDLKAVILKWFHLYQQGNLMVSSVNIKEYNRRTLTAKLAKLL